jgi:hypothetical protein
LSDIRGKPIEFRQYGKYAPQLGCRFDCHCGEVYFAIWRAQEQFWGRKALSDGSWKKPTLDINGYEFDNNEHGKFAIEHASHTEETGVFTIDLSHYAAYNDEKCGNSFLEEQILNGEKDPRHLCVDNALDTQLVW